MSTTCSTEHDVDLEEVRAHLFDRAYMGGVERNDIRVKATGEVFTPTPLVENVLDKLDHSLFSDPEKTFLDPACGDGQFLASVFWRKLECGIPFETALSTLYGIDKMWDNVRVCRERLLCGQEHLRHHVKRNIVEANTLEYHFRFDDTPQPEQQDLPL